MKLWFRFMVSWWFLCIHAEWFSYNSYSLCHAFVIMLYVNICFLSWMFKFWERKRMSFNCFSSWENFLQEVQWNVRKECVDEGSKFISERLGGTPLFSIEVQSGAQEPWKECAGIGSLRTYQLKGEWKDCCCRGVAQSREIQIHNSIWRYSARSARRGPFSRLEFIREVQKG
jgi:hypothetical protein